MRSVLLITLVLLVVGVLSCRWGPVRGSTDVGASWTSTAPWVRTVDGWERGGNWQPGHQPPPRLHPMVVAAGQLLVSMLALVAATPGNSLAGGQPARSAIPPRRRQPGQRPARGAARHAVTR